MNRRIKKEMKRLKFPVEIKRMRLIDVSDRLFYYFVARNRRVLEKALACKLKGSEHDSANANS